MSKKWEIMDNNEINKIVNVSIDNNKITVYLENGVKINITQKEELTELDRLRLINGIYDGTYKLYFSTHSEKGIKII